MKLLLGLLGIPLLVALFLYSHCPMLIIIAVLAYPQIKQALWPRESDNSLSVDYYSASFNDRINYGVMYLG